jgi:hypothetical protein
VFLKKAAVSPPTAIAEGDAATLDQPPVLGKQTKEERAFVWRLDLFLLAYGCASAVIKYLDQQNIRNAYVSGMKEDLGLYGKELNYFSTYFSVRAAASHLGSLDTD